MNTTPAPWKKRQVSKLNADTTIVFYEFGYHIYPDAEAVEAYKRIAAAYDSLAKDQAAINKWSGNLVLYGMRGKVVNPEIDGSMQEACFKDAKASFPGWVYCKSWKANNQGLHGLSVELKVAPE